ncbi:MAG: lysophospholipid acyltransferase family protein [Xanthobacteraceae bacterium]
MLRLWLVIVVVGAITAALIPVQAAAVFFQWPMRHVIPKLYHRMLCALIGVRVHVVGSPPRQRPLLILANHSSWLDITVITSMLSVVFVAKSEVATWPLFGLLAKLQRSIFVDRRRRHKTGETSAEIARRLVDGDPVVLFAEGTSSDGNRVLPFRTALIGAAEELLAVQNADRVTIQPLSVAYIGWQGLPLDRRQRTAVSWYGAVDLIPHLINIVRSGAVDVVLTWGEPVTYDDNTDRKLLAKAMEGAVRRLTTTTLRSGAVPRPKEARVRPNPQVATADK